MNNINSRTLDYKNKIDLIMKNYIDKMSEGENLMDQTIICEPAETYIYTEDGWKTRYEIMQMDLNRIENPEIVSITKIYKTALGTRHLNLCCTLEQMLEAAVVKNRTIAITNILDLLGVPKDKLEVNQRLSLYYLIKDSSR